MSPVLQNLFNRWPRDHAALGSRLAGSKCLVVGIEQVLIGWIELAGARQVLGQDKRLEEPSGVGQVPLGGGRIGPLMAPHILGVSRGYSTFPFTAHAGGLPP